MFSFFFFFCYYLDFPGMPSFADDSSCVFENIFESLRSLQSNPVFIFCSVRERGIYFRREEFPNIIWVYAKFLQEHSFPNHQICVKLCHSTLQVSHSLNMHIKFLPVLLVCQLPQPVSQPQPNCDVAFPILFATRISIISDCVPGNSFFP